MESPRRGGSEGGVHQAGEPKLVTRDAPHSQRQLDPIDVFYPGASDDERPLRVRIHRARDIAQARAIRSKHGRARTIYWVAAQMAGDWVFCRAPLDDLQDILASLSRLFLVAGAIERMEAPDE